MSQMQSDRPTPAEVYERVFVPALFEAHAGVLVDLADPQPGERMLDVACGTGIVARTIAPIVGADGSVVGLDLRPGMLAVARSVPAPPGATIEWREGDATALELADGSFDLVVCEQGFQFFEDKAAAAREISRVLVPGGRFVLAVWEGVDHQSLFRDLAEVEARHLREVGLGWEDAVEAFSLHDPDELRTILEGAGFEAVELSRTSFVADFAADTFISDIEFGYGAVVPAFVEDPGRFETYLARVTADSREILERYREDDRIRFEMPTHLAVARRPA